MSEIKRKELRLSGASEVSRLHAGQLDPPELVKLRNMAVSRSDLLPRLRPDLAEAYWKPETRAADWQGDYAGEPDFINCKIWSYANEEEIVCSRFWPFRSAGTGVGELAPTYTTGTVTNNASDRRVLTGSGTSWLQEVWPGCWYEPDGSTDLYLVTAVTADTELILDDDPGVLSGADYTIYKTWHPDAGLWPVKVERLGNYMIAGPVVPVAPIDANHLCGPFASDGEQPRLASYEWYEQIASPAAGAGLRAIAGDGTGSGIVVAVGDSGKIIYSDDGNYADAEGRDYIEWTLASGSGTSNFYGVSTIEQLPAGSQYKYIAVGANGIVYTAASPGSSWTSQTSGTSEDLRGVIGGANVGANGMAFAAGENGTIIRTVDEGVNWSAATSGTSQHLYAIGWGDAGGGSNVIIAVGANGTIVKGTFTGTDMPTFSAKTSGTTVSLLAVSALGQFGDGNGEWVAVGYDTILYSDDDGDTWTEVEPAPSAYKAFRAVGYGTVPETWYVADELHAHVSELPSGGFQRQQLPNAYMVNGFFECSVNSTDMMVAVQNSGRVLYQAGVYEVSFSDFDELSDTYRAHAFAQAGGYMVYGGMSEWDAGESTWVFHPRRVRWAAPGTVGDFSGTGNGYTDLNGVSQILDMCGLGNSIIVGATDGISCLVPGTSSTWEHHPLAAGLWQLSNMIELNDVVYFVASDGLLYAATTAGVVRVESGFDLSLADDWEVASSSPISICYSASLQCLLILRVADPYKLHLVEPEGGQHAVWELPEITADGNTYTPAMVSTLRSSESDVVIVSYAETDTQEVLLSLEWQPDEVVKGLDDISADDEGRWHSVLQTGRLRFAGVGETVSVKDVEVHTFAWDTTEVGDLGSEDPPSVTGPDVLVEVRSGEDSSWRSAAGPGTVSVGTSSAAGTDTAFSHKVGTGDDLETVFATPCRAVKARVYTETGGTYTLTTAYTVTDTHEITFTTAPTTGHGVYVFWSGAPEMTGAAGDYIRTSEGLHRITSVTDAWTPVLDWYPTETLDGTVVRAQQMAAGKGILTFGVDHKVEDLEVRVSVVPRNSDTAAATAEIEKLVVSYVTTGDETKSDD